MAPWLDTRSNGFSSKMDSLADYLMSLLPCASHVELADPGLPDMVDIVTATVQVGGIRHEISLLISTI